ncbi:hypothetical protein N7492_006315 [Penicillium capsulatum]|uniref:Ribosomal RNA methyltransferase FtsJ domain-containing protein n=1 Tax=Penicillium capsulatum TaxID=69766 RepID=A0A9W9I178_9EURO|nr:hypothetical protein N7492_006315 [Penicillium capsulatum]KAJ6108963.1 hypothetical protein N7512_008800 [Penicillium capsulatum]
MSMEREGVLSRLRERCFKSLSEPRMKSDNTSLCDSLQVHGEMLIMTVWKTPKADAYFQAQKARLASPTDEQNRGFFYMMIKVGMALQATARIVPPPSKTIHLKVLDICMAPGGYAATVSKVNPTLMFTASLGGHPIALPNWKIDRCVDVRFQDITMLVAELGFPDLASQNHDKTCEFSNERPFNTQAVDLVFCDGKVLDSHTRTSESTNEAARLSAAQIVLTLQRIKYGATLVMLLHQAYGPASVRLLEAFDQFSTISLVKHQVCHIKRTSFYLIAKNIDPAHARARTLVNELRHSWRLHTALAFGVEIPGEKLEDGPRGSFGEKLIQLAEPVWRLQTQAMLQEFLTE